MSQDLRLAFRSLRARPGSNAIIVTLLAGGIAACTLVFSLARGFLLRPLDFPEPELLVRAYTTQEVSSAQMRVTEGAFYDLRRETESFAVVIGARNMGMPITDSDRALNPLMREVSTGWFETLGAQPLHGRLFSDEDFKGRTRRVILGHGLWQSLYGGDPDAVGRTIELAYEAYEIVGVMPASYRNPTFPQPPVLWLPMAEPVEPLRGRTNVLVLARLADGRTPAQANEELAALSARIRERHPQTEGGYQVHVEEVHSYLVSRIRPALLALLGAVGFVLLIACTNVANLLLARSVSRRREIGVRMALGASRLRLARQLLAESAVLGAAAAALGILIAYWTIGPLLGLAPSNINVPLIERVTIDGSVLAFTAGVTLVTSLLFGLAPMLLLRHGGAALATGRGAQGNDSRHGTRLRGALVVAEVALSLVLLIGAGLMVRTLINLKGLGVGFESRDLLVVRTGARGPEYGDPSRWSDFHRAVSERLAAIPGVEAVAACEILPMFAAFRTAMPARTAATVEAPESELPQAVLQRITPGFLRVAGIPLLAGRGVSDTDLADGPPVGVISQSLARRVFGDRDPIGQELTLGPADSGDHVRIVGLVGDLRGLVQAPEPPPILYVPYDQRPVPNMTHFLRSPAALEAITPATEQAIWNHISRDVPVYFHTSLEQVIRDIEWQPRFMMQLLIVFALFALALASVGLYAVLAFAVAERTREIGVRVAVGAQRRQILGLVLGSSARLAALGIGTGVVGSWLLSRSLSSQLYGVEPGDPLTIVTLVTIVGVVAIGASLVPALRATRVDPVRALVAE